jgi:site-specific DNA-cytosine methylase
MAANESIWHTMQVCGNMLEVPTADLEADARSNHDHCMARLDRAGYEVRWRKVNPKDQGIPTTRARLHYQGIDRRAVRNAKQVMNRLAVVWKDLCEADFYIPMDISDFLVKDKSAAMGSVKWDLNEKQRVLPANPKKPRTIFEWQQLHQKICSDKGAHDLHDSR